MKKSNWLLLTTILVITSAILCLTFSCKTEADSMEADITAINELYDQYCLGANTGDLDLFISLWADDATRMDTDIPAIVGKENIRAYFKVAFEQFNTNVAIYGETEVQVSDDLAFSRGTYTLSLTPKEGGPTTYIDGKWLDILKRQADGSWKIYIDCVNYNAPPKNEQGYIGLSNPEKVIEFEDKAFESAIRDCFDLDDGDITWRDIGYRTALDSDDFQPKGRINTLEDLKWFVNLQKIEMQEYEVEGDLSSFSHMENLEVLLMWETDVSGDLSSLSGLENLRAINLSHTDVVGDLSSLSGLETIEEIELVGTAVKGDVSCFDGHENLEVLELEDTYVTGQKLNKTVLQAYELRMNGQADSAKVILEQVLSEDSTNAVAWYEIARTKHHMGLEDISELISGGMADIQQTVQKAVENDPDNVIYQYYKGLINYSILYMGLKTGKDDISEDFTRVVESYKSVLILKPDYHEAKLFLVELFEMLPSNMGGDSVKAEKYVRELEEADVVFGAKAREIVMPENANYVVFWQKIKENQMDNADVHEALGRAYLHNDNVEEATKCFEKAISLNSKKNILYVDLGRYYIMQAMQNPEMVDSVAPLIENAFETYLNSQPEPINPLKAFVISKLAMIKFLTDDEEGGNKLHEEAMTLDPYHSKAFGTPSQILFDPPDEISRVHGYFFRPF